MLDIRLSDRYVDYSFTIDTKFTLLQGNSATGKTTLYELFRLYSQNHLNINCTGYSDLAILPDTKTYSLYPDMLMRKTNTVYILNETHSLFNTPDFEKLLMRSDNYFIIISREQRFRDLLDNQYSIKRIYSSGKYHTFEEIDTLSPELTERIWNQMPNAVKPEYGSTKEEIVANYYKQYSHLFQ